MRSATTITINLMRALYNVVDRKASVSTFISIVVRSAGLLIALIGTGPALAQNAFFEAHVDSLVRSHMEAWNVPGVAIAVVEDGETILLKGYGVSDVVAETPVDPRETIFHVASISKPVTASGILRLVDRDRIALDRPINSYLEAVDVNPPFDAPITLSHLLAHTSGFDRSIIDRKTRNPSKLNDLQSFLAEHLPPVVRPPGEVSVYSNYGYALAGLAAANAAGLPFHEFMSRHVFKPLGMVKSSFGLEPDLEASLATGYGWSGTSGPPVDRDYIRTVPASMLRTTAADMAVWMSAILAGRTLLDPTTAKLMLSRQFSNHPHLPGRSFGLSEGSRYDPPEFLHAGGAPGFTAALVLLPAADAGIFVAFNSQTTPWTLVRGVLERYDHSLSAPVAPETIAATFDTDRFAGYYRNLELPVTSLARLGELVDQVNVTAAGPGRVEWDGRTYEAVAQTAFREHGGSDVIGFGEADGVVLYFFRQGAEYGRVSWFGSRSVQLGLWALFVVAFLAGIIVSMVALIRKRRSSGPRWPHRAALAASVLNVVFVAGIAAALVIELEAGTVLAYGPVGWLLVVLTIPFATAILSITVVCGALLAWRRAWWTARSRAWLTAQGLVLAGFIPFLAYWHLLGYP